MSVFKPPAGNTGYAFGIRENTTGAVAPYASIDSARLSTDIVSNFLNMIILRFSMLRFHPCRIWL